MSDMSIRVIYHGMSMTVLYPFVLSNYTVVNYIYYVRMTAYH